MPKGISLHIGLNRLDFEKYGSWDGRAHASLNNAWQLAKVARYQGFEDVRLLLNEEATKSNVTNSIEHAAECLEKGDLYFLNFSGHGAQEEDLSDDEPDLLDEGWCLYDGVLIDDVLFELWKKFQPGVRILVVADCCHSGESILNGRAVDPKIAWRIKQKRIESAKQKQIAQANELRATVRLLSACRNDQYARSGPYHSWYTARLLEVWNRGEFKKSYAEFHRKIQETQVRKQLPQHLVIGPENPVFEAQSPFRI